MARTDDPDPGTKPHPPTAGDDTRTPTRWERRTAKIRDEIERNRKGDYVVPTWVLAAALIALIAGWAALVLFG